MKQGEKSSKISTQPKNFGTKLCIENSNVLYSVI